MLNDRMANNNFDAARDSDVVGFVGFFCSACLVGKPLNDQSADLRYCQGCYEFLSDKAKMLSGTKRPKWVPKSQRLAYRKVIPVSRDISRIMSTSKGDEIKVGIFPSVVPAIAHGKRGPKFTDLPGDLIRQLASDGMGAKAIATRLKKDYRLVVSYKTIQRRLQGVLV